MDYEKKYKEALEKAHNLCAYPTTKPFISDLQDIFPELKESEDEKIRKVLKQYFEDYKTQEELGVSSFFGVPTDKILAWLEKQGKNNIGILESTKQKLEDNLNNALEKETPESCNEFLDEQGEHKFPSLSEKEIVCLKRILDFLREEHNSYAGKDFTNEIAVLEWLITHPVLIHSSELQQNQGEQNVLQTPTREMILAVWDLGNIWKELTHGVCSTEYGSTLDYIQKHWKESEYYLRAKQGEQKPVFEMKTPEESLGIDSDTYNKIVDECIYGEQKPAWSEEDEKVLHAIKNALNYEKPRNYLKSRDFEFTDILDWLKSLKDRVQSQTTWKPSEEMLEALYRAIPENVMAISEDEMLLDKLYQGLKYGKVLSEK